MSTITIPAALWEAIWFDTAEFEYSTARNEAVQLKLITTSNVLTLLADAANYPVCTAQNSNTLVSSASGWKGIVQDGNTGAVSRYWGSIGPHTATYLSVYPSCLYSYSDRLYYLTNATLAQANTFKLQFQCQLSNVVSNFAIGFGKSTASNQISFLGIMLYNNTYYAIGYDNIGTQFNSGGSAGVLDANADMWWEISHDTATDVLTISRWETSPGDFGTTWTSPSDSQAVSTAGKTLTGMDCILFGQNLAASTGYSGELRIYGAYSAQVDFLTYSTALDTVYTMEDSGVAAANWDSSKLLIPGYGTGSWKDKYYCANAALDVANSDNRATIDAGLNASWLTEAQLQAAGTLTGRYLYRVHQANNTAAQQPILRMGAQPNAISIEACGDAADGAPGPNQFLLKLFASSFGSIFRTRGLKNSMF